MARSSSRSLRLPLRATPRIEMINVLLALWGWISVGFAAGLMMGTVGTRGIFLQRDFVLPPEHLAVRTMAVFASALAMLSVSSFHRYYGYGYFAVVGVLTALATLRSIHPRRSGRT